MPEVVHADYCDTRSSLTAEWCHRVWWSRSWSLRTEDLSLHSFLRLALNLPMWATMQAPVELACVGACLFPSMGLHFSCIYSPRVPAVSSSSHVKLHCFIISSHRLSMAKRFIYKPIHSSTLSTATPITSIGKDSTKSTSHPFTMSIPEPSSTR